MFSIGSKWWVLALGLVCSSWALRVSAHPLDGLRAEEIARVREILSAHGKLVPESRFSLIELKEPDKAVVLAWRPGQPVPRMATAYVLNPDGAYKAVLDLHARKLERWEKARGEPMLLSEEFANANTLALSDERMRQGLAKRGVSTDQAFCIPLTAGMFGRPEERGSRLMKVPCYVKPSAAGGEPASSNFYARPIEGLFALVDLRARKVLDVTDTGVVPIPRDGWGYTAAELVKRQHPAAPPATASGAGSAPRRAKHYKLQGSELEWDMWRFHLRADRRPGLVLSRIEARDGASWRSVLYQAHLSEVFVPYMDPDEGWYWRTYMDSGEYGFGLFLSPLRRGVDCPADATFLPVTMHTDQGAPLEMPDAICVFERETGNPIYRHYEIFAHPTPAEGRAATELIVRSASEVGNYDYFIDYVFQQDGMIRIMIGATGLDAVKGVAATSMSSATAAADTRYGTLIAPNLVAPNHDHFFSFRLDFDVDGVDNAFMRSSLEPAKPPAGLPRRSLWETHHSMPQRELEGRYKLSAATPAEYHVMHRKKRTALGHAPAYMIVPQDSVAYSPLDALADPPIKRNAYIEYTIWNTPYTASERYAGGEYALQSDGTDGLAVWVKQNRKIDSGDLVTWYTMGFHHVPHVEDWPIMSTHWKSVTLMPYNFFDFNPALKRAP
jgi:primary-amine oxidase